MKKYIVLFLKGMAMGIANVIPGVSGGTIALITNIYEELINSLKSFDKTALHLILSLDFSKFIIYTNLYFLLTVFGGSVASVFSIASIFKYLFIYYPVLIWAFFFGLILASIYFIGKRIENWNKTTIISLISGTLIALSLSLINPASENNNLLFVFMCGIVGISGMMLPGLSGSFILILMGNYELLMVTAITDFNITLLSVFLLGSVFGLMSFSHILSWVFKHYRDATLALLTGFIIGSLSIIWPWKKTLDTIIVDGQEKILSYELCMPNEYNQENIIALALIMTGIFIVYQLENFEPKKRT